MSEKQLLANLNNSKLSTGPKSEAGKQIVSQNATKFGIFSTKILQLASENSEFQALQNGLIENYEPANQIEAILVNMIVEATYRLDIVSKVEKGLFKIQELKNTISKSKQAINREMAKPGSSMDIFSVINKIYHSDNETPIGENKALFENVKTFTDSENEMSKDYIKLALAFQSDAENSQTFSKLGRFRKRIEYSLYKAIDKLDEIQKKRFKKEARQAKSIQINTID